MKNKIIIVMLSAVILGTTACQTPGGSSDTKQFVIQHGAKVALTAAVMAVINNNEDYHAAFVVAQHELNAISWEAGTATSEEIIQRLKAAFEAEAIPQEQQDKVLMTLSAGLGIYEEFMRANNYENIGQNQLASALSTGISNALLAGLVFEEPETEINPFTL